MTFSDYIVPVASILSTLAAVVLAAHLGFKSWKQQRWLERRAELAEEILADFYKLPRIIRWARSPLAFGSEGETRPRMSGIKLSDDMETLLNSYYVPIERLRSEDELFSRMEAARYRCMALFGKKIEEPFQNIREIRNQIEGASRSLIRTQATMENRQPTEKTHQIISDRESIIWQENENDEIQRKINDAIIDIEKICRPFLDR